MRKSLLALVLLFTFGAAQAAGVGVYYYVANHSDKPVKVFIEGLGTKTVKPTEAYEELGKTKYTAYVFYVQKYLTTQEISDNEGTSLCKTQQHIATYWDMGPTIDNFSVLYIKNDTNRCSLYYTTDFVNVTGDTGRVYYDIY